MNSAILFFLMSFISLIAYKLFRQHFLSPTFLSSAMFAIFAFEYFLFNNVIGADVSLKLVFIVFMSELSILCGELLAEYTRFGRIKHIKLRTNSRHEHSRDSFKIDFNNLADVNVPKFQPYFLFTFEIVVAFARLYKLASYYGGNGIAAIVASSRFDYARGGFSFGVILALCYYLSQVICYIYIALLVQKFTLTHRIKWAYILPIIGYCLCIISTTSRTEFIKVASVFIAAIFIFNLKKRKKKINFIKISICGLAFIVFFLIYGFAIRGITYTGIDSIIGNIVSYSCASLYGLDYYLSNPLPENHNFGMYTLELFYELMGKNMEIGYEPTYFMKAYKSNIYTSLNMPLQDYGFYGMLVTRFLLAYLCTKIQKKCLSCNVTSKMFYFYFMFVGYNVYIFLMAPIGDKTYLLYLNPRYLIEIIVAYIIVAFMFMKPVWIDKAGNGIKIS